MKLFIPAKYSSQSSRFIDFPTIQFRSKDTFIMESRSEPEPIPCYHYRDPSTENQLSDFLKTFGKRNWKRVPSVKNKEEKSLSRERACGLCVANGFRLGYNSPSIDFISAFNKSLLGEFASKNSSDLYDAKCFSTALRKSSTDPSTTREDLETPGIVGYKKRTFLLPHGQFGEVYHTLALAAVMYDGQVEIVPGVGEQKASETDLLMQFYSIPVISPVEHAAYTAKDEGTRLLIEFLIHYGENSVLDCIRSRLDNHYFRSSYSSQSYLGKYWLNRFIGFSNQLTKSDQRPGRLPKAQVVQRMAVVHVRRNPETTAGRSMSKGNLRAVLSSIRTANDISRVANQQPNARDQSSALKFTHVMLYGDIFAPEAQELARDYSKFFELFYVSQPWKPNDKQLKLANITLEALNQSSPPAEITAFKKEQNFWAECRHDQCLPYSAKQPNRAGQLELPSTYHSELPKTAPFQVKILSFFFALRERYGENVCWIGFRSGFLDGAAFTGTPEFYLDDEFYQQIRNDPQSPLWQKTNINKRIVNLGNALSTFIRVDIPATTRLNNEIKLQSNDCKQLVYALFALMLANDSDSRPNWVHRQKILKVENVKQEFLDLSAAPISNKQVTSEEIQALQVALQGRVNFAIDHCPQINIV